MAATRYPRYQGGASGSKDKSAARGPLTTSQRARLAAQQNAKLSYNAYNALEVISKGELTRIGLDQLPKAIPDFDAPGATKDVLVTQWLRDWITEALASGQLQENLLLPRKADLSKHLGVSIGTVQNAIRYIEDEGHVESKQRIGTLIRRAGEEQAHRLRKQVSKRDQAVLAIKQLIAERGYQPGQSLPSARELAVKIGSAPNTTRLALEFLAGQGLLENRGNRGNKANWGLLERPVMQADETPYSAIESETLIDQLERDLKALIAEKFKVNDRLPSHMELADQLKVSIKTVHDAMRRLVSQRIVSSKRGRYGTFVLRKPENAGSIPVGLEHIFVPAQEASFYNYEKVEKHLKKMIGTQYKVGDKLPAMEEIAQALSVSSNTIRKALQNLAQQGVVSFSRGRHGGTFVSQLPAVTDELQAFQWVSMHPEAAKSYRSA